MRNGAVLLLVLLVAPSLVSAGERGFYLGGALGEKVSLTSELNLTTSVDDRSYKLFGGYYLGRHFAIELARHDLGTQVCCAEPVLDAGYALEIDAYSLNLVGKLPVHRFDLFAKVGYLFWDRSGTAMTLGGPIRLSEHGRDLMSGVGADINLSNRFAVRLEWEYYDFDFDSMVRLEEDADSFFIGVRFKL
jgi:opacity protein-like surface antigen